MKLPPDRDDDARETVDAVLFLILGVLVLVAALWIAAPTS